MLGVLLGISTTCAEAFRGKMNVCDLKLFSLLFIYLKLLYRAQRGGAVVKVLALHARDPIWALVLIPAATLPIQLPACGLGK